MLIFLVLMMREANGYELVPDCCELYHGVTGKHAERGEAYRVS